MELTMLAFCLGQINREHIPSSSTRPSKQLVHACCVPCSRARHGSTTMDVLPVDSPMKAAVMQQIAAMSGSRRLSTPGRSTGCMKRCRGAAQECQQSRTASEPAESSVRLGLEQPCWQRCSTQTGSHARMYFSNSGRMPVLGAQGEV